MLKHLSLTKQTYQNPPDSKGCFGAFMTTMQLYVNDNTKWTKRIAEICTVLKYVMPFIFLNGEKLKVVSSAVIFAQE